MRIRCMGALVLAVSVGAGQAKAELVIDYDTTIDYTVNDDVRIIEGASPPTTVEIVEPAYVDGQIRVLDGSILSISGGELRVGVTALDAGTVNLSGGFGGENSVVAGSSTLNISGGYMNPEARVTGYDSSTINISAGYVGDSIEAEGSSTVNVYGYTLRLGGGRLTGFLQDYTPLRAFAWTRDHGEFILHELPQPPAVVIDRDTTIDAGNSFPNQRIDVIDGIAPPTTIQVVGGGKAGHLSLRGSSVLSVFDGSISTLAAHGASRSEIRGGIVTVVDAHDASRIAVFGGRIWTGISVSGSSTVEVSDGYFGDQIDARDSSRVDISGGEFDKGLDAGDHSVVNVSGGEFGNNVDASGSSIINILGGSFWGDWVEASGLSTLNITGGQFPHGVEAASSSTVNISGGTIPAHFDDDDQQWRYGLAAANFATVNISGGTIERITCGEPWGTHTCVVNISGTGFNYPYGEIPDPSGTLTGTLAGGDPINAAFEIHSEASIVLVPEPSTVVVLLTGGLILAAHAYRRRRSRTMRIRCMAALVLAVSVGVGQAKAELLIDYDTTIDYTVDGDVRVIEGADPPTIVQIVDPAYLREQLLIYDGSIVQMSGGAVHECVHTYDASTLDISGGSLAEDVWCHDTSTVNISGGELSDYVVGEGASNVSILGGSIWGVAARGNSLVDISGGSMRAWPQEYGLLADDSSTILLRGTGFNYPYGEIPEASGTLTGFLASGDPLQADFEIYADGSIVLVPEPATAILSLVAGLAGVACASRRRRKPTGSCP